MQELLYEKRCITPLIFFKWNSHLPKKNENSVNIMKNGFYFLLKAPCSLEIFTFFSLSFLYVIKRVDKKAKFSFKVYDVTD